MLNDTMQYHFLGLLDLMGNTLNTLLKLSFLLQRNSYGRHAS